MSLFDEFTTRVQCLLFRVLLCVGEDKIILINDRCAKLAEYPAALVALCGTCADDRRLFGLVTRSRRREHR